MQKEKRIDRIIFQNTNCLNLMHWTDERKVSEKAMALFN